MIRVTVLIVLGAVLTTPSHGQTSFADFHKAVRLNDLNAVQALITEKNYLNALNEDGRTALQEAIRYGHQRMIRLLLRGGVDVHQRDSWQQTALHYAADGNEKEAARALIRAQAVVDTVDKYQYTPLHFAARKGHADMVELLVEAGADVNAQIDVGFTAIDLADRFPHIQEYLSAQGGKTYAQLKTH